MLYGVSLTPGQWVIMLFLALLLVFVPFMVVESLVQPLPEPLNVIAFFVFAFILFPALICYAYRKKMYKSGQAGVLFFVYALLYNLLFIAALWHLISAGLTFKSIGGVIITGSVAFYMLYTAFKTKREFEKRLQAEYEAEREDDVKRQAEAILLAEKMKEQNKNP